MLRVAAHCDARLKHGVETAVSVSLYREAAGKSQSTTFARAGSPALTRVYVVYVLSLIVTLCWTTGGASEQVQSVQSCIVRKRGKLHRVAPPLHARSLRQSC